MLIQTDATGRIVATMESSYEIEDPDTGEMVAVENADPRFFEFDLPRLDGPFDDYRIVSGELVRDPRAAENGDD